MCLRCNPRLLEPRRRRASFNDCHGENYTLSVGEFYLLGCGHGNRDAPFSAVREMGVYVFSVNQWIKVGHYKGRNPWSRVSGRGFSSCLCPREVTALVSKNNVSDTLRLELWYPQATTKDERKARANMEHVGEWLPRDSLTQVKTTLDKIDTNVEVTLSDKRRAFATKRRL